MINRIIYQLQIHGYVDETNDKIVTLGLHQFQSFLEDIIFVMVLGLLFGSVSVGLMFEVSFRLSRVYAGGYHSNNKKVCFLISFGSTLICMVFIFFIQISNIYLGIITIFASLFLLLFSPIENKNKRLNCMERRVYRHKSIIITLVNLILYTLFIHYEIILYAKAIGSALLMVAVGLVVEKSRIGLENE